MALSNYTELLASVATFSRRADLTGNAIVADFIALAETRVNKFFASRIEKGESRPQRLLTRVATTPIAAEFTTAPTDMLGPQAIVLTTTDPVARLKYVSPQTLAAMLEGVALGTTDQPTHYTVIGTQIRVFPAPDQSYPAEILYWGKIPPLASAVGGLNWLLTDHPDVYLYGALEQVAKYYRRSDEIAQSWKDTFLEGLEGCCNSNPLPNEETTLTTEIGQMLAFNTRGSSNINTGEI